MLLLLLPFTILAQSVGDFGSDPSMLGGIDQKLKAKQEQMLKESMPSTGFINAEHYYLGPGDIVFLKAFPAVVEGEMITISPEGFLVLPRSFGNIDVRKKSLSEITVELKTKMKTENLQLSLYKAKTCIVEIDGNVLNDNLFTVPGSFRISDLYNLANSVPEQSTNEVVKLKTIFNFKSESRLNSGRKNTNDLDEYYSQRNIRITRSNGDIVEADLIKALNSDNFNSNPYLMPGDKVKVLRDNYEYNTFQIRGGVSNPTTIMHKTGDKLSDLIRIAGGFSENADIDNITLYSADNNSIKINLDRNFNLIGDDPVLGANSILIVGEKSVKKINRTGVVTVSGEVNKPGAIIIKNGETKISEIIELAGGLKETAYLPLARVLTKQDAKNNNYWEQYREDIFFQYSDLSVDDTLRLNKDIKMQSPFLSVDFEAALSGNDDNIPLNDGDKIIIPKNPKRVYVFGKVYNPGYVEFVEGKNYEWYVQQAGGELPSADEKRTRIIRGNNLTWVEPEDAIVNAGDMIYIPSYPEISQQAEIQKWATYTSVGIAFVNVIFTIIIQLIYLNKSN